MRTLGLPGVVMWALFSPRKARGGSSYGDELPAFGLFSGVTLLMGITGCLASTLLLMMRFEQGF
jgi:hypothetical protein